MTDETAAPHQTPPAARRARLVPLGAALTLALVGAVSCGDDDGSTASDGASSSVSVSTSPSESSSTDAPSESSTPTTAPTVTPSGDPVPSPVINKAAKAAIKDDFPALVPSGVPAGWTVVSAAYNADADTWWIELTDAEGASVRLAQSLDPLEDLVTLWLGADAQAGDKVDLSDFGTGKWRAYTSMSGPGIGKAIAGTSAVVFGADQDSIVELAQELLTAEDGGTSDNGG